jgi:hypothetical protein
MTKDAVAVALWTATFISYVVMGYYMLKTTRCRKPGEENARLPGEREDNVIFQSDRLTSEGLQARKRFFVFAAISAILFLITFAYFIAFEKRAG